VNVLDCFGNVLFDNEAFLCFKPGDRFFHGIRNFSEIAGKGGYLSGAGALLFHFQYAFLNHIHRMVAPV
jgi:hypothetical protein